ncbi:MAG: PadR family transcriptional regulator [Chloroflexi bacterium]|nr:PadR family transcriptional regulator [Chloroflexota bacterium]
MRFPVIELLILGLLEQEPLHGYELKRRLERLVGYFGTVSYGSLYPMLRKLEARGHVTASVEEQAGPNRIVYQVTRAGRDRFLELAQDSSAPFGLRLLFFQSIPPAERKRLLGQQRDAWSARLAERRRAREHLAGRAVDRYRAALLARAIDHLERDLAWIQHLIEGEDQP